MQVDLVEWYYLMIDCDLLLVEKITWCEVIGWDRKERGQVSNLVRETREFSNVCEVVELID